MTISSFTTTSINDIFYVKYRNNISHSSVLDAGSFMLESSANVILAEISLYISVTYRFTLGNSAQSFS